MEILDLRTLILSKYRTVKNFAKVVKWREDKVARLIKGQYFPNEKKGEYQLLNDVLDLTEEQFFAYFFPSFIPKWDKKGG